MKRLISLLLSLSIVFTAGCSVNLSNVKDKDDYYKSVMKGYENKTGFLGKDSDNTQTALNPKHAQFKEIPVLEYHCIDDNVWGVPSMFVSPSEFDRQMAYLKENGYTAITFRDLTHADKIAKPVMITFDDGYENNYINAYPILKKYNMKATIFLIVKAIGKGHCLKMDQINIMKDLIDFESHTMSHAHLVNLHGSQLDYEVGQSKKELEKLLKKDVFVIAYPFGSYNNQTIEAVRKYYKYGVTVKSGFFADKPGYEDYQIDRIHVINTTDLDAFIKSIEVNTAG